MAEWVAASRVRGLIPAQQPASVRPAAKTRPGKAWPHEGKLWHILTLVAAVLLILAFFLPWWSLRIDPPSKQVGTRASGMTEEQLSKDIRSTLRVMEDCGDWITAFRGERINSTFVESYNTTKTFSVHIWGWHTLVGVFSLVFSLIAIANSVTAMILRGYRHWVWIGLFANGVLGLVISILSVVFLASAPTESIGTLFPGFSFGVFMALLGGLMLLVAGIAGGVIGVLAFSRGRDAASA